MENLMTKKQTLITDYLKDRLYEICIKSDLKATRFFVSLSGMLMGLGLIYQPINIHDSPEYIFMLNIADVNIWGLLFILQSIVSVSSLLLSVKNIYTLLLDGVLGSILWTSSTTAYILGFLHVFPGHSMSLCVVSNIIITLMVWWSMIRCWASRKLIIPIQVVDDANKEVK